MHEALDPVHVTAVVMKENVYGGENVRNNLLEAVRDTEGVMEIV